MVNPVRKFTLVFCAAITLSISTVLVRAETGTQIGFLVVAPDRGFWGNEETRQAVAQLEHTNKDLVFVTDNRSKAYLDKAITGLKERGATEIGILPLFIYADNPKWQLAQDWLNEGECKADNNRRFNKIFGESYLAVDVLETALNGINNLEGGRLTLLGAGADSLSSAKKMEKALVDLGKRTNQAMAIQSVDAVVWADDEDREKQTGQLKQLVAETKGIFLTFHFGKKLDGMMNHDAYLAYLLGEHKNKLVNATIDTEVIAIWLQREVNRKLLDGSDDIGVVVLAHGSDFHWNQNIRDALAPLQSQYTMELTFSMADRLSIETALRRLEQRGMKGAVIVRVFGRKNSFFNSIKKMVGMDIEQDGPGHQHKSHRGGHSMGGGRIRTPLVVTSVGGLEAHPLFAEALLDRAKGLSRDPKNETIILVAHGSGNDQSNEGWLETLGKISKQMRDMGGHRFRAIEYATWREDWPDKREKWIERVKEMVKIAQQEKGHAIVIPARTNSRGPAEKFLAGMTFRLGEGFAPHPLFARWVETQIKQGVAVLTATPRQTLAKNQ